MLLGPSIKSLLGLFILIATLKYWPDLFRRLFLGFDWRTANTYFTWRD